MGARVIAMLNAIRVARDYDLPYYVGWTTHGRTREEVRDPSFIFHPDYIKDKFFDVTIMSEIYDNLIDLSTVDAKTWTEAKFRKAAAKGKSFMSGAAMGVTVLPWEDAAEVTARLYRRTPLFRPCRRNGRQDYQSLCRQKTDRLSHPPWRYYPRPDCVQQALAKQVYS
ncbi:MAG: hypothetical protein MUR46_14780, partial [Loktanella sp.]|nr:hypothetical protein [Loktanella sp.]